MTPMLFEIFESSKPQPTLEFDCPECKTHSEITCQSINGELKIICPCGYIFLEIERDK